ncbi:mandelate racemase/muconate lactonizing enzyme family protein [Natronococcus occultus]|uniref:o-succinylbenzoate synthase n=1 Tax=Natronococcus occultus SP4 TaxID=694430 RepID=L0JWR6_9EURY|nr:o-succinylbenzoate synthase [Natronococcus occultus]AGB37472.1 enolase superfamily enzyme related to L-alanine-DL-glutamate epimerase [Natronococcus occultus SP4]
MSRYDLEYRSFSLSLADPLETASGTIESRDGFLVRVTREDGAVGYGEATPLPGWTESLADCEAALERAQEALDSGDEDGVLEAVDEDVAARHSVSLALADLAASSESVPLYRYYAPDSLVARVPVNATVGDGSIEETVAAARGAVERGFSCCKLKVGRRSVDADIERVRRVREAVGPSVELRADANGAWNYEEALAAVEAFDDEDVALVEQPLPAGALEGHAELRGRGVEIALDEGLLEHGVDAICEAQAADAVVVKPMPLGGLDVAQRVTTWVAEFGITPLVTTTIDGVVARTGAVHLAASLPELPACGLATGDLLAEDLGRDPVLFENGAAVVPQAKGLGVEGVWEA